MSSEKLKVVFMGTPEFSVPTLKAVANEFDVVAVVTAPDKPRGRGRKLTPTPVKSAALELGIEVLEPESLKDDDFAEKLKTYNADIFCVVAFRILPEKVFTIPKIASFNVHTSILPKYRGAAPINWAIIKGETRTGVTSFVLDKDIDTGQVIGTKELDITPAMTAGELHDAMMPMAAELAVESCHILSEPDYKLKPQDDNLATPAPKIFREDCEIDFSLDGEDLKNFINGMSPIPGAWTEWDGKKVKILKCELNDKKIGISGHFSIENDNFLLQTSSGSVKILLIQPAGKKVMKIEDFLAGYRGNKEGIIE